MVAKVTWEQALAWRMRRHYLDPISDRPVTEVVHRLCGVQAQVAALMRARGCAWIALGPKWRDFDPERYRLVEDHSERFTLAHGDPRAWM